MSKAKQTAPDLLTEDEKAILAVSVRLNSALRHIEQYREAADDESFINHVNGELVRCNNSSCSHPVYPTLYRVQ
jgi:hypothetical protein